MVSGFIPGTPVPGSPGNPLSPRSPCKSKNNSDQIKVKLLKCCNYLYLISRLSVQESKKNQDIFNDYLPSLRPTLAPLMISPLEPRPGPGGPGAPESPLSPLNPRGPNPRSPFLPLKPMRPCNKQPTFSFFKNS